MSEWKGDGTFWAVSILSTSEHDSRQKDPEEGIQLLRPLSDNQVVSIRLAKVPFEPTPTFSFGNLPFTRVRKSLYF